MSRSRRGTLCALAALVAMTGLAGCGDPALWARYRAERALWNAWRQVTRLNIAPGSASQAEYDRAAAAFSAVTAAYPAVDWARPGARPMVRDVGALSGRAQIGAAMLEELRGRDARALELYTRVAQDYPGIREVALEGAVGRARLLDRIGPVPAAEQAWSAIVREFPIVDPVTGEALEAVLDAPLRVAHSRVSQGDRAGGAAMFAEAARRYDQALVVAAGRKAAPAVLMRLSQARTGQGDVNGALAALRRALAEPAARGRTSRIVLALADCSLEAGSPDTALSYASWAERSFTGEAKSQGTALAARAWEARGDVDSALDAYGRYLDRAIGSPDSLADTRLRRAALLERSGRWEEARTEYRTLAGLQPTHPLAFEAMLRIVAHHQSKGEGEAVGIEGRRALQELDRLIATRRDESVQWRARNARARVQMALGLDEEAARTLAETWAAFPGTAVDDTLGLRVAGRVALHPEGRQRALDLYRTMLTRGRNADTRRTARAAMNRLQP